MSRPFRHILFLCMLLNTAAGLADTYQPLPFTARYSVHLDGFKVGELERRLYVEPDGRHVLEQIMETTGVVALFKKDRLVERSAWIHEGGQAIPLGYHAHYTGRAKDTEERIDFDWQQQTATSQRRGKTKELPLVAGMTDKLMHQIMLHSDIATGKECLEYTIIDRNKVKTYAYEALGTEALVTARGMVNTIKIKRKDTTFWLAPEWDYLLVQLLQENDDGTIATYIQEQ